MSEDPYSRVYWRVMREYPDLIADYSLMGQWVHLLVIADQAYPAPAYLPITVKRRHLERLMALGLVSIDGPAYSVRGLGKHREARSEAGRRNAAARWQSDATALGPHSDRNADPMLARPSQAKPSQDEPSQADALALWWDLKAGQVSEKALAFVRDLLDRFGDERLCEAMQAEYVASGNAVDREFLSRVKSRLLVAGERRAQESEKRRADAELAYQRRMKEEAESMPEETRKANMARLKDMLKTAGMTA